MECFGEEPTAEAVTVNVGAEAEVGDLDTRPLQFVFAVPGRYTSDDTRDVSVAGSRDRGLPTVVVEDVAVGPVPWLADVVVQPAPTTPSSARRRRSWRRVEGRGRRNQRRFGDLKVPGRDLDGTRRVFVDRLHPGWVSHTLYRGKVKIFTSIFTAAYETFRLHPVPFAYGSKPDQRTARRKPPDSSGLPADERPPAADSTELGETPSPTSTPFSPTDPAAGRPAGLLVCSDPAATAAPQR